MWPGYRFILASDADGKCFLCWFRHGPERAAVELEKVQFATRKVMITPY